MISVLLVDDEPTILDVASLYLGEKDKFTVTGCKCASDALDALQTRPFDIIVSDYEMPEINGIEFLKVVRARGITTPFIIFTGHDREEVAAEGFKNGASLYLQKGGNQKNPFVELKNAILHLALIFPRQGDVEGEYLSTG